MSRSLRIRKPRPSEIRRLLGLLDEPLESLPQRHAQAILLYNDGMSATEIAHTLERHVNTIYAYLTAFDQHGLPGVYQEGKRGAPARLSPAQCRTICRIADQSPQEVGLSYGRWSLSKLRTYLERQGIVSTISREHLWRILKKGACVSAAYSES